MKRNIEQRIEEGHKLISENNRVDMNSGEMDYIREKGKGAFYMIHMAFLFGVSVGHRMKK